MVRKAFSVYDKVSELYGPLFFMSTVGEALRAFKELVQDKNTTVGKHPSDFKLVMVGGWDDKKCAWESCEPTTLAHAAEFVGIGTNVVPLSKVEAKNG